MDPEIVLQSLAWGLPFFGIAGVLYAFAKWKEKQGRGLYARAQELLAAGDSRGARDVLLTALWKANETPSLERRILGDLGRIYGQAGVPFAPDDYELLIRQFEALGKKGSHKALAEMKQVQALKQELIARMPSLA